MKAVEKAKQELSQLAGEVREEAAHLAEEARLQVGEMAERRQAATARKLGGLAEALRDAARRLERRERGGLVSFADRWADQVERASWYLREHEPSDVLHEVEDFARRRPALFLSGTFVAGVLAARFLKSSQPSVGRDPRAKLNAGRDPRARSDAGRDPRAQTIAGRDPRAQTIVGNDGRRPEAWP